MKKLTFVAASSVLIVLLLAAIAAPAQERKAKQSSTRATATAPTQTTPAPQTPAPATNETPASPEPKANAWTKSAVDKTIAFVPDFFAGLLILFVGLCVAAAAQALAWRILPKTGLEELLYRHNIIKNGEPQNASGSDEPNGDDYPFADREPRFYFVSEALSRVLFWIVVLLTSVQVARTWHLESVANGLGRVVAYLPHLFAAVAIFVVSIIVADWVAERVSDGQAFTRNSLIRGGVRGVILTIGGFLSLRELQIAPDIVKIAFTLVLGSIAVAVALAFGLGARGVAEQVTTDAYQNARASSRESSFNKAA